jgi:single-stranded-DNA-specific exonuclease
MGEGFRASVNPLDVRGRRFNGGMDKWQIPSRDVGAEALAAELLISPLAGHLLQRLGFSEAEAAKAFLEPKLRELCPPETLPNMDLAVARLDAAIDAKEPILLFGDYDVDGITGSAVLSQVLRALGAEVEAHIPDRHEGYGVNIPRIERAAEEGVKILITIDNGIAALDEARRCRELGLDLIVCDHHTMREELPEACALIHPRLEGSTYANPNLCGAGVAFKLAWAIAGHRGGGRPAPPLRELLLKCLSLVAMGTVADVVPLVGENRVIVRYGLKALTVSPPPGLAELLRLGRVEGEVDSTTVAFRIAPRINAAGRMGRAGRAFDLLTTDEPRDARALASELDRDNKRRREVQDRVFEEASAQVREVYGDPVQAAGIVVYGEDWPHGVVGIVASRLVETFHRPVLIASNEGEKSKGSGRSVEVVDLLASLEPHRELFLRMGGHAAALGFTIETERLPALRAAFSQGVADQLELPVDSEPHEFRVALAGYEVVATGEVRLGEITREFLAELERLAPYGSGNPEPVFVASDVVLAGEPRLMGQSGKHVSFLAKQDGCVMRTVAFNQPELYELLRTRGKGPGGPRPFQFAFKPKLNRFRGQVKVELEYVGLRFPEVASEAATKPELVGTL